MSKKRDFHYFFEKYVQEMSKLKIDIYKTVVLIKMYSRIRLLIKHKSFEYKT